MKLIGVLGGLGWEATSHYYRLINDFTQRELGNHHTARVLLHSVNHGAIKEAAGKDDTAKIISILAEAALSLKAGGSDFVVMANNSLHQYADQIQQASGIDLLHISDPTGMEIQHAGHHTIALLGARATMEGDFYSERLRAISDATVIAPDLPERVEVNRIIYDELARGIMRTGSRDFLGELVRKLGERGAEAAVLGCCELTSILTPDQEAIRFYDTTRLHAKAAVKRALEVTYA